MLIAGRRFSCISHVSARFTSKPLASLGSKLSFQGCLKVEKVSSSVAKAGMALSMYSKENVCLWSKEQACLLLIKYLGSLSSKFHSHDATRCVWRCHLALFMLPCENRGVSQTSKECADAGF